MSKAIWNTNKNYWGAGKKQFEALHFLDLVGKTELKQVEDIFLQNQLNNLVIGRDRKKY